MKEILKEFDDIYGENHHKICVGKNCECHKVVKQFIIKAISQTREETIREVENILNNYFKGLIMIPMPELTLNKIKQSLNKLKK